MLQMSRGARCGTIVALLGGAAGLAGGVVIDIMLYGRPTWLSAIMVITGLLVFGLIFYSFRSAFGSSRLRDTGLPARATVLEVWDTGWTLNENAFGVGLRLRVERPGAEPYEARVRTFVSRLNPDMYRPGMILDVRVDPRNPQQVAVVGRAGASDEVAAVPIDGYLASSQHPKSQGFVVPAQGLPPEAQQAIQAILADADGDGVPDMMQQSGTHVVDLRAQHSQPADPVARLQKLEEMRAAGLITDEEYQAKRAEILRGL